MPIVFEEVTGDIVPERDAAPADLAETSSPDGEDVTTQVRRALALMRERERRLHVD